MVPMTRFARRLLLTIAFLLASLVGREAHAATINAASCSEPDVQNALTSAHNGDTVTIPAGTCTWTTALSYTLSGSIAIIGAGNQSIVGGGDVTVIIDHVNHASCNCGMWAITTGAAATIVRISGITIEQDSGSLPTDNGIIQIVGSSQNFRWDHSHFLLNQTVYNSLGSSIVGDIDGWMYGVFDHNLFDLLTNSVNNGFRIGHGNYGGSSYGNGSWAAASNFGSGAFLFFENNTFNGAAADDCNDGGRIVFRYNTFNDSFTQAHEMENDYRGCRAYEIYNNTYNGNASDSVDSSETFETRMGTGLIWNNVTTGMHTFLEMDNDRTNTGHGFAANPNGWGYCGTTTASAAGEAASQWDQSPTAAYAYACVDQPGRGVGQLLTGVFPNKVNSVAGTIAWPNNALEPIYEWLDQYNVPSGITSELCHSGDSKTIAANRDFYCYTLTWNGSSFTGTAFNGTAGTGSGLLSARPSTCTVNVAYWATDANTLFQCSATNTWTAYYTPFTYPHPLTVGSQTSGSPPAPTNLQASVN